MQLQSANTAQPTLHWHTPHLQVPWPEQFLGQESEQSQMGLFGSELVQRGAQVQVPSQLHVPCPVHGGWPWHAKQEQLFPAKPKLQVQEPLQLQVPWPEQTELFNPIGQAMHWQAWPTAVELQAHVSLQRQAPALLQPLSGWHCVQQPVSNLLGAGHVVPEPASKQKLLVGSGLLHQLHWAPLERQARHVVKLEHDAS